MDARTGMYVKGLGPETIGQVRELVGAAVGSQVYVRYTEAWDSLKFVIERLSLVRREAGRE
jgi:hypothetical protein